ncbi:MAG: sulfite exporter TauE/SafE family protein [Elusimicrobia bacterium]|nr:sulfite exporter TauE/SafE family protein [Elusimicrobiota bacterium]
MVSALAQGFWLGLAVGPQCFMSCAPVVVPLLCAEGRPGLGANAAALGRFLAGRLAAYLLLAAAAAAAAAALSGAARWLPPAGSAVAGVLLLAYAWRGGRRGCCAATGRPALALGFLTGAGLCPALLAALTAVLASDGPGRGALFFAAFFAATSLYLLPVLGVWPWLSSPRVRLAGRLGLAAAGLWRLAAAGGMVGLWRWA